MFDSLTEKFSQIFNNLTKKGIVKEKDIKEAVLNIKNALRRRRTRTRRHKQMIPTKIPIATQQQTVIRNSRMSPIGVNQ